MGFIHEEPKSYQKPESERGHDNTTNTWHVIIMETVRGRSFTHGILPLNSGPEKEKLAVTSMLTTAWGILHGGVVNADQWHNVLFPEDGGANFIDFEGAGFLDNRPMLAAMAAHPSAPLRHKQQLFQTGGSIVKDIDPDDVLGCMDFDVRFRPGSSRAGSAGGAQGRPELFANRTFRSLCGHCFAENDEGASSFCRKLGYSKGGSVGKTGRIYSEDAVFIPTCEPSTVKWMKKKLAECTGCWGMLAGTVGPAAHNGRYYPSAKSCASGSASEIEITCLGDQGRADSCDDSSSVRSMLHSLFWLIPAHAKDVAAESVAQRQKIGVAKLDAIVEEEWQNYLKAVAGGYGADYDTN